MPIFAKWFADDSSHPVVFLSLLGTLGWLMATPALHLGASHGPLHGCFVVSLGTDVTSLLIQCRHFCLICIFPLFFYLLWSTSNFCSCRLLLRSRHIFFNTEFFFLNNELHRANIELAFACNWNKSAANSYAPCGCNFLNETFQIPPCQPFPRLALFHLGAVSLQVTVVLQFWVFLQKI